MTGGLPSRFGFPLIMMTGGLSSRTLIPVSMSRFTSGSAFHLTETRMTVGLTRTTVTGELMRELQSGTIVEDVARGSRRANERFAISKTVLTRYATYITPAVRRIIGRRRRRARSACGINILELAQLRIDHTIRTITDAEFIAITSGRVGESTASGRGIFLVPEQCCGRTIVHR